jgi:hypothetical protein
MIVARGPCLCYSHHDKRSKNKEGICKHNFTAISDLKTMCALNFAVPFGS